MGLDNYLSLDLVARISAEFEKQISPCYGPCGMDKLVSRGEKLSSASCGEDMIQSFNVWHPIGKMIIKSVLDHYSKTGDGVKTFIILLSSILRKFADMQREQRTRDGAVRVLLLRSLEKFRVRVFQNFVVPSMVKDCLHCHWINRETTQMALHSFLSQRTSTVDLTDILSRALYSNLVEVKCETLKLRLNTLISEFDNVCIASSHEPPEKSRIEEVLIMPQDYLTYHPLPNSKSNNKQDLGLVLLKSSQEKSDICISVGKHEQALSLLNFKLDQTRKFCRQLSSKGVKLLLSDSRIDHELRSCCLFEKISTIQYLQGDDLDKLSRYFGILPLIGIHNIAEDEGLQHFGLLKCFGIKTINGQNYAYLEPSAILQTKWKNDGFYDVFPFQIIVCGLSTSGCQLDIRRMKNALKQLNSWLVPYHETSAGCRNESTSPTTISKQSAHHYHENCENNLYSSSNAKLLSSFAEGVLTSCVSDKLLSYNPSLSYCGLHIPANGAFETANYFHIKKFINNIKQWHNPSLLNHWEGLNKDFSEFEVQVCKVIADAFMEIPYFLIQNSYASKYNKARNIANLLNKLNQFVGEDPVAEVNSLDGICLNDTHHNPTIFMCNRNGKFVTVNCRTGKLEMSAEESPIEPLRSKIELVFDVLHLCQQLIKLEVIIPVHKNL